MVLGLLVWMAQNVSSQSRYDKDKLYNLYPAKVSDKVLGYDAGASVILKSLSRDDRKQQWNINELSGSFRFVNVFEDKALRADVDHKALVVTEVNGSDEAQLWSIQETANGVRLVPANTPSLMLVCQKDGRLQLMDRKKAETMEASLFQIRVSAVPMPEGAGMAAREKVYWEDETCFEENKEVYVNLASTSEIIVQADKNGISEDAVSVVIPGAVLYLPLEDLVDFEKEKERLHKEKDKLTKELARSKGMLSNEKFLNNAKPEKVQEEKDKLAKYEQMMAQVEERLAQFK